MPDPKPSMDALFDAYNANPEYDVGDGGKDGGPDQYTHSVINKLFKHSGAAEQAIQALRDVYEATGAKRFTWEWFETNYPNFPVRLVSKRIRNLHKMPFRDLRARFTETPIFAAYAEAVAECGSVENTGLVFEWPLLGTTTVLHNFAGAGQALVNDGLLRGFSIRRVISRPLAVYWLEPLESFAAAIPVKWW